MSELAAAEDPRPSWHFWAIAVVALIWNAFGALDYVMTQTRNEAYMAQFTPEQLEYFYGFPTWAVAAWAIAVWASVLGAILLLLRKRAAVWLFATSLVCIFITSVYNFILSDGLELMGGAAGLAISLAVIVIAILLLAYARAMSARGVLV